MKCMAAVLMGVLLLAGSGCVTMVDQNTIAQQQADMEKMRTDIQRVQERLNGVELEQQNLGRDIGALRGSSKEDTVVRNRLDTLERQVQSVAASRENDRKQIVTQVSAIVGGGSSSGSGRGTSSGSHSSRAQSGYEHVVESGQSLSAIAAAYKTSVSAIKKANNLKSSTVRVGQKLFIPKD